MCTKNNITAQIYLKDSTSNTKNYNFPKKKKKPKINQNFLTFSTDEPTSNYTYKLLSNIDNNQPKIPI